METEKNQKIGSVLLDLSKYSGDDRYCDGEIEDRLLEIARDRSPVEFPGIIEESKSWPVLYHLSPFRENIIEWLPIEKNMKVLEVGAGCGATTGMLARKAGHVDCVDLSLKRSRINAYRHMDCDNVVMHVGNFTDIEPLLDADYDYITLIGVFEYAQAYIGGDRPYESFLKLLKKHLSPEGRVVIAIENRFGMKYWAGCREDHIGTFFGGIEGYPDGGVVRTFSEDGLRAAAVKGGFGEVHMYYPYPDYKFMTDLYSEKRLPHIGELTDNTRNFDNDRLELFDESRVFDAVISEGRFREFSNSYLMILGKDISTEYVKYASDRDPAYSIRTRIESCGTVRCVTKSAVTDVAAAHVRNMAGNCRKLKERYKGSGLEICGCSLSGTDGGTVTFDYVPGISLNEMLIRCEDSGDTEGFERLLDEYLKKISYRAPGSAMITDLDLIFQNIIIDGDKWTVIDYEWTDEGDISPETVAFRALFYYTLDGRDHDKLNLDTIIDKLGLSQTQMQDIREDEMKLQRKILGTGRMTMPAIRDAIANRVYGLDYAYSLIMKENKRMGTEHVQIYEDSGEGFSEENSSYFDYENCGTAVISYTAGKGIRALRIDPCNDCCIVCIRELTRGGHPVDMDRQVTVNGVRQDERTFIFATKDPNIVVSLEEGDSAAASGTAGNDFGISMDISRISEETAVRMTARKDVFGWIKRHK
jgi:SAM-dependent methyltransferase